MKYFIGLVNFFVQVLQNDARKIRHSPVGSTRCTVVKITTHTVARAAWCRTLRILCSTTQSCISVTITLKMKNTRKFNPLFGLIYNSESRQIS